MVLSSWWPPLPRAPPQTSPQQLPWKFTTWQSHKKHIPTCIPALGRAWCSADCQAPKLQHCLSLGSALLMPMVWSDIQGLYLLVVSGWFICLLRAGLSFIKVRQDGKWSHRRPEKREGEKQTFLSTYTSHILYSFNFSSPTSPCG